MPGEWAFRRPRWHHANSMSERPSPPEPPSPASPTRPAGASATPAPRSVLTPWQRPVVKALVVGGAFVAATGLFLVGTPGGSSSSSIAFLAHVVVAALLIVPLFAFVVPHA